MEGVAVVTGASLGIGEAITRRLLDSGCTVITRQTLFVCSGVSVSGSGGE